MGLKVLFIGDTSGKPDEGMKKICSTLQLEFDVRDGISSEFVSVKKALSDYRLYQDVDIIHYIAGPTYRSIILLFLLRRRIKKAKTILSFTHPHWNFICDILFSLIPPDAVIVQSKKWFDWGKRKKLKMDSVPLSGVDLEKFHPVSKEAKEKLKQELGLDSNKKVVLHAGHLNPNRNLDCFISLGNSPDFQPVIIASTTTIVNQDLEKRLKEGNVLILREYISEIEKYYQAADFYLFPTISPRACVQIPLSVIEAMATNTPIISTKFEGLPFYFPAEKNIINYVSEEELNDLPAFLSDSARAMHIPDNLEEIKSMSWNCIADRLLEFYQKVISDE